MRTGPAGCLGLIACLALAPAATAQVAWEVGLKGGVGLGKVTGDTRFFDSDGVDTIDGDIKNTRTGFAGGGFAIANINERFGIRLEALYSQKGGQGDISVTGHSIPNGSITGTLTFKFDYFEIPLLAVGSFPAGEKARIDIFGGPAIAFNTAAKLKLEAEGQSAETDFKDFVKSTDFGIALGAGVTVLASPAINVVIDGRYEFGLTKIPDNTGGESVDLKNGGFAFMAGLSFPVGQGAS